MINDIVVYDHTVDDYCPVLPAEEPVLPFRVCIAKSTAEYENGCCVTLALGAHFSVTNDGTIYVKGRPSEDVMEALGLQDRYIIVVENPCLYGDAYFWNTKR